MFTGLVEEVGECLWLKRTSTSTELTVIAQEVSHDAHLGDSISVDGCCLTVTARRKDQLTFELLDETLDRTNLGKLRSESPVNLERALRADARLGGHFVQGHIDSTVEVISVTTRGSDVRMEFDLPAHFAHYVAWKGSIAINGVSLTVSDLEDSSFAVWLISVTRKKTNLGKIKKGDFVNLEFDVLAKYAERLLTAKRLPT
ncbi:riboflavin synthase [soil metagenome]